MGVCAIYSALSAHTVTAGPTDGGESRGASRQVIGRHGIVALATLFAPETILATAAGRDLSRFDPLSWVYFRPRPGASADTGTHADLWPHDWPAGPELAALVGAPPAEVLDNGWAHMNSGVVGHIATALASHSEAELERRYGQATEALRTLRDRALHGTHILDLPGTLACLAELAGFFGEASAGGLQVLLRWEYR